ncbi:beta-1,4-galactosyltransferase 3-like [Tubulanus polymorphus]|uniref:beta-1,4-galactosyltransferase 3-like n=1 Tax=Tubulanus polymorphus TaxID=672921 RepID=UPI003DA25BBF
MNGFFVLTPVKKRVLTIVIITVYVCLWIFALFNHQDRVKVTMPDVFISDSSIIETQKFVKTGNFSRLSSAYCRLNFHKLKQVNVDIFESPSMSSIISAHPEVKPGGHWAPSTCRSMQKLAIIVPYRNRFHHLKILLKRLHSMLQLQSVAYRIFVIEQAEETQFNRALLMNIGYLESLKYDDYDCFIFHDVDLIPEHNSNIYLCDNNLRHLAAAIDEWRYHVMYYNYAGGVAALSRENMILINGFANTYWGWGSEDDDFSARTMEAGLLITRPPNYIGKYKMIRHNKATRGETSFGYFMGWRGRWMKDGLNSMKEVGFNIGSRKIEPLYTNITVKVTGALTQIESETKESIWWFFKFYFP